MGIFIDVVLPVILIFAAGYVLQWFKLLEVKSVSTVCIYLFVPCLVFTNIYEASFDERFYMIILFAGVLFIALIAIIKLCAKLFKLGPSTESALILSTAFMNAGNFGVPIMLFSLGESILPYAVFFMVVQNVIMNTAGVYFASRSGAGAGTAIKSMFRLPAIYAVIAALLFKFAGLSVPGQFYQSLEFVGQGAIPLLMIVLGMQLANIRTFRLNWPMIGLGSLIRLGISPLIALLFIQIFELDPIISMLFIVIASMPSAATTTLLAVEYDAEPGLVSSITLVTTLLSIVTLSILLNVGI
ncbi:hypothetical protein SAMN04488127_0819 [Bhargavaea ginsengi]|uniref:Transporter n=1 Tax=Bhargavaea ginsengi TaxID=426757 RepID=A0A1H6UYE1_9BACL|nr:AEC family transporter [Bhargavaea ginsengi]SEI93055.1 hypothetical protein SAMN04488127_0819 [Bhargavaea ginsengi]